MKLSIKALVASAAIIWSLALLFVGIVNLVFPGYGMAFLEVIGSIYPGYHPGSGPGSVVIGSVYGAVDAGICAAIFGWLYNVIS